MEAPGTPTQTQYNYQHPQVLPNAVAVLVLGILSIVMVYIGWILAIIALAMSSTPRKLYKQNPSAYSGNGMLTAGFVLSIVSVSFYGLILLIILIVLAVKAFH